MRALWTRHGAPGGRRRVTWPTRTHTDDLKSRRLATVSGDAGFARDFFARYIEGRELVDYERLLAAPASALRKVAPGRTVGWRDPAAGRRRRRRVIAVDAIRIARL